MSFIRSSTLRASSIARLARPARAIRAAELQPWQRTLQRRTYASGHGAHGQTKTSDLPWAASAIVGTAAGLYYVVSQDYGHGEHHDDHHDKHEEAHEEEAPAQEEAPKEEAKEEPKEESKEEAPKEEKKPEAEEKKEEEPKEEKSEEKKEEPKAEASPDKSDEPTPRKEPKSSNETSGKQEGLSNADTKHTHAIHEEPEKSKKGEGVAETAKLKGTVSTERPQAENKEERGKAQSDKDQ
ncbi:hypothetical protein BS50DRAFT_574513 [Corynespora cassiicola Philippines]|uniref:Uncharacterized protein n=1 Tax=Corynespora cassiicola Philippines TaxID=1448308 RepID=A0A2T2NLV8_CORCC|nr:hypothetical protein BS50DRAFT_574513 [Corynespora cassiicola Philippines]